MCASAYSCALLLTPLLLHHHACLSSALLPLMLTCVSLPPNLKLLHQLNIANMLPFQPAEPDLDLRVSPPSTARPQEILTLPSTGAFSLPTPPPPKNQILPPLRLLVSRLPSFLLLKRKPPRQTGLIPASFTPLPNLSIIQQTNPAEKYPKKGHSTLQVLPLQQTAPAPKHPTKGRPGLQVLPLAARRIPLSSLAAWTCTISFHLSSNPQASCSQAARLCSKSACATIFTLFV